MTAPFTIHFSAAAVSTTTGFDASSAATAAAKTGGAQLYVVGVSSHGERDGGKHFSMAAGPAARVGQSREVGSCYEYGAIVEVKCGLETAVALFDGVAIGNNGNVVS